MAQRAGLLFAAAFLLATVSVLWLATAVAAGGLAFKEPLEWDCGEHIPDGWYEATRIEATWEWLPPRLSCSYSNAHTGATAAWDAGSASVVPFGLSLLGGSTSVLFAAASIGAMARAWRRADHVVERK